MTIATSKYFALKDPGTRNLNKSAKKDEMMAMNGRIPLLYNRRLVVQKRSMATPGLLSSL